MNRKLFFSTDGLDGDNDEALRAFAERVWEVAVREFGTGTGGSPEGSNTPEQDGESDV